MEQERQQQQQWVKHEEEQDQQVVEQEEEEEEEVVEELALNRKIKANITSASDEGNNGANFPLTSLNPDEDELGIGIPKQDQVPEWVTSNNVSSTHHLMLENPNQNPSKNEDQVTELTSSGTNGTRIDEAAVMGAGQFSPHEVSADKMTSVYFDDQQGITHSNGYSGQENGAVSSSVLNPRDGESDDKLQNFDVQKRLCNEEIHQDMRTSDDKDPPIPKETPSENLFEVNATSVDHLIDQAGSKVGLDFIEEIDPQLRELDVEAVLAKQETHDLYCPNCNSCITKRVILRKRKRTIQNIHPKPKRDKPEAVVGSNIVSSSSIPSNLVENAIRSSEIGDPAPLGDAFEREPAIFRCLSCFSFFIPRGNCFKLLWNFRGRHDCENLGNLQTEPLSNSNPQGDAALQHPEIDNERDKNTSTFGAMAPSPGSGNTDLPAIGINLKRSKNFASNKVKPVHEELQNLFPSSVDSVEAESWMDEDLISPTVSMNEPLANKGNLSSSYHNDQSSNKSQLDDGTSGLQKTEGETVSSSAQRGTLLESITDNARLMYNDQLDKKKTADRPSKILFNTGEPTKDATLDPQKGVGKYLGTSTSWSSVSGKRQQDIAQRSIMEEEKLLVENGHSSFVEGALWPSQSFHSEIRVAKATDLQETGVETVVVSAKDVTQIEKAEKDMEVKINDAPGKNEGGDVILLVQSAVAESSASNRTETTLTIDGANLTRNSQLPVGLQQRTEASETQNWEILKSIVYGGLIESMTSMVVLVSAAGAGAATLNIVALGLANLIGGLFIIGHNLVELKNDSSGETSQLNTEDRYYEQLGQRRNFLLHAVMAVLSFLIFGSVPIIIYGILINKDYYTEVKLGIVVSASIICIALLAIGKVYSRKPPKSYLKTVSYYVALGLAASGLSYIAGDLIKGLLEKFSQSSSGFYISMPSSESRFVGFGWSSS